MQGAGLRPGGGLDWGSLYGEVQFIMGNRHMRPFPPPVNRMTDRQDRTHYFPATSLAGGKNFPSRRQLLTIRFEENCSCNYNWLVIDKLKIGLNSVTISNNSSQVRRFRILSLWYIMSAHWQQCSQKDITEIERIWLWPMTPSCPSIPKNLKPPISYSI